MADELYEVRNALYLGNFHQVIAEASHARTAHKKPEDVQAFNNDRDVLVARAQIGLGQLDAVIAEQANAAHPSLIAARKFAQVVQQLNAGADASSTVQQMVEALPATASAASTAQAVLTCAALIHVRDYASALKIASQWATDVEPAHNARQVIESKALVVDCYLRLNRPDLAEKEVASMKQVDDEATLTILSSGLVALRLGATKPEKLNQALSDFNDVTGRCGQSVLVLNLLALTNLAKGKPTDAERNLLDALAKKSGDADTIANLVVVASQLGKPSDLTQRYVTQAKASAPRSLWAAQYVSLEDRFRDACAALQPQ